jgi:hypothetical protein
MMKNPAPAGFFSFWISPSRGGRDAGRNSRERDGWETGHVPARGGQIERFDRMDATDR